MAVGEVASGLESGAGPKIEGEVKIICIQSDSKLFWNTFIETISIIVCSGTGYCNNELVIVCRTDLELCAHVRLFYIIQQHGVHITVWHFLFVYFVSQCIH